MEGQAREEEQDLDVEQWQSMEPWWSCRTGNHGVAAKQGTHGRPPSP